MTSNAVRGLSWLSVSWLAVSATAQQNIPPTRVNGVSASSAPGMLCVDSLFDHAGGPCITAASIPTYGRLYPLSTEFFISSSTGNIGMGTAYPAAQLHIEGTAGILATGQLTAGLPFPNFPLGSRFHYSPTRGSIRAGIDSAGVWNWAITGEGSAAFGVNSRASGYASTAVGKSTVASGRFSFASGLSAVASNDHSVSMGVSTQATGYSAVAFGSITAATGTCSLVQGINATASGDCSAAIGNFVDASSYASLAIGRYNLGGTSPTAWVLTDPVFEVGIGTPTTPANALTVLKNGNVGVGAVSPEAPLHVQGGSDATPTSGGYLLIGDGPATNLLLDNNELMARNNGVASTLSLNNNGGNVNISAAGTGRVAIGHGAPAFTLDVAGTAGKPGGGSWSVSSDLRLKKNVRDLDGALDRLLELRGVTYEYIDPTAIGELPGERVGFIAQEVERVFPDWVGTKDDGMKFLTVRGFEALGVEALRELAQRNDELESQVDGLRAQIDAMRDEMTRAAEARDAELRQWIERALAR